MGQKKGTLRLFDNHKAKIREWCGLGIPISSQAKALDLSPTGLYHYVRTRRIYIHRRKSIRIVEHLIGLEPITYGFEDRRSIRLS